MLQTLKWSDDHSLGVDKLDSDHKKMFELMSEAISAVVERAPVKRVEGRIDAVLEHAQTHFVAEELLMDATAYPHTRDHREEHRQLLAQFLITKQDYTNGTIGAIDLCAVLVEWLIDHIAHSDRALADYLREGAA